MRTFVIGDIHGGYRSLLQCLERAGINYSKDTLIVLGDVVDGWSDTPLVIEELLKIKNMKFIMGNHDEWCKEWLERGAIEHLWDVQGGRATIDAYVERHGDLMTKHRDKFFKNAPYYYVDEENRLFVHGGIPQDTMFKSIRDYDRGDLMWDRSLADLVLQKKLKGKKFQGRNFKEIYLGHTTTTRYSPEPVMLEGVILMDTGGGYEGKLSLLNIDTKELFQSDLVSSLYPNESGRN